MDVRRSRHHHREGTRPEAIRELRSDLRNLAHPPMQKAWAIQVDDDGMRRRPPLGFENLPDGGRVLRISAQPIDRLGRKSHKLAVAQGLHGGLDLDLGCSDDADHSGLNSSKPGGAYDRRIVAKLLIRDDRLS